MQKIKIQIQKYKYNTLYIICLLIRSCRTWLGHLEGRRDITGFFTAHKSLFKLPAQPLIAEHLTK